MNPSIFRAYDIRGVYGKDFNDADFEKIGNAFSRFTRHIMIVGRDCRVSGPNLKAAVMKGIARAGIDVMDVGMTPRGATMFWGFRSKLPSMYVSASHLPAEWNGLKFNYADGTSFSEKDSAGIKAAVLSGREARAEVPGMVEQTPVLNHYKRFLKEKIPVMDKEMKVLLDCGNGTAGLAAPEAFGEHGCEVSTLFVEPDGSFPNRHSEIKEKDLGEAMKRAKDFDAVVAFDGDADRVSLVDNKGRFIPPEVAAYVIMMQLLKEQKGPVTANIECSRILDKVAEQFGRKVIRTPVGYTFVVNGVHKSKSCFGVERSMHFIIPSVMPIDDGIIAGLYAVYSLSKSEQTLADVVDSAPKLASAMRNFEMPSDEAKFNAMEGLKKELAKRSKIQPSHGDGHLRLKAKDVNTMDGVRLDFDNGWVLVRASNTSPLIRLTVEGESQSDFNSLMEEYDGLVKEAVEKAGGKSEK